MLTRFAGRPRHQQTLRSPLVLSAEQSTAMLPARSTRLACLGKPLALDPPVASSFAAFAAEAWYVGRTGGLVALHFFGVGWCFRRVYS